MSYKVKGSKVKFSCPNPKCGVRLTTKLSQAGTVDKCPECLCKFRCAGVAEYDAYLETKRERDAERTRFVDKLITAIVVTLGGTVAVALGLAFMIFCIWICTPSGGGGGYSSSSSGGWGTSDVDQIIRAKEIVRAEYQFPDTVTFGWFPEVTSTHVILEATGKNGFGVPQTRTHMVPKSGF